MRTTFCVVNSAGCPLAATLRLPGTEPPHPSVIFSGPLATVRDQVVDRYAELLTERGFVTLTLDHRNFGESGGLPRQHEDPQGKLCDLQAAVTTVLGLPHVDPGRIALCGVAVGAGYVLQAGAADPRVAAVASIAGAFNSPRRVRSRLGAEQYRELLHSLIHAGGPGFEPVYVPVVAKDDEPAMITGREQFEFYTKYGRRSLHWENRITAASAYNLLTSDALSAADIIGPTPLLLIHSRRDNYCSPEFVQEVHDRAEGPKELVWIDTHRHTDLYHDPVPIGAAVEVIVKFLAPASAH